MAAAYPVLGPSGEGFDDDLDYSSDDGGRGAAGRRDEDERDKVVLLPAMLASTEREELIRERDMASIGESRCLLCELGTLSHTAATNKFGEIMRLYEMNRREVLPEIMYESICKRYNTEVVMMRKQRLREANPRNIRLSEIRRHFEDNHDMKASKVLENELKYLRESVSQMKKTSLWFKMDNDPSGRLIANSKGWDTYLKVIPQISSLVQRLGIEERGNSFAGSKAGKNFH